MKPQKKRLFTSVSGRKCQNVSGDRYMYAIWKMHKLVKGLPDRPRDLKEPPRPVEMISLAQNSDVCQRLLSTSMVMVTKH